MEAFILLPLHTGQHSKLGTGRNDRENKSDERQRGSKCKRKEGKGREKTKNKKRREIETTKKQEKRVEKRERKEGREERKRGEVKREEAWGRKERGKLLRPKPKGGIEGKRELEKYKTHAQPRTDIQLLRDWALRE